MERLKILLSAYACLPGRGSEPGIGWNTARALSHKHDVWVITRGDNRPAIEAELERRPNPHLHFVFYDLPGWTRDKWALQIHYVLWQLGIYRVARRLHKQHQFDLAHHVSYVRWWIPSFVAFLPVPFVWGPVGGVESIPRSFRASMSRRARLEERLRDTMSRLAQHNPLVRAVARRSALVLANNDHTAAIVKRLGARHVRLLGESCIDDEALATVENARPVEAPVQFASLTRLLHWKGVHLGLEAFARLNDPKAVYYVVGEGPERNRLIVLAHRLGIASQVLFLQDLSRNEWLRILRSCDALVHPCLSNSGSMVSLEAMAAGRPVLCLDIGGIRMQVSEDTGYRVAAGTPKEAIQGLARAMRAIAEDRVAAREMGARARARVERLFTWERRGEELHDAYREVLARLPARATQRESPPRSNAPSLSTEPAKV